MRAAILLAWLSMGGSAFAQMDLSGTWEVRMHEDWMERGHGPDVVDFLGLPLNDEARAKALSYSASQQSAPERQCLFYQPHYMELGPFGVNVWSEDEPVTGRLVAWKISAASDRAQRTIWMDGRPHPSRHALHPIGGFSTGVWDGNALVVTTTHMKAGYTRRNGVPSSDETTMTERFVRHGDLLTVLAIVDDPVYFSEPYVVSRTWGLEPDVQQSRWPAPCTPIVEVINTGKPDRVEHFLPGQNPLVNEVPRLYNLPPAAVMGGAHTMYPEYRAQLKDAYVAPTICVRYCCGWFRRRPQGLPGCIHRVPIAPLARE